MDFSAAKQILLAKPDALEDYPFGPDVAVFKIKSKMFATLAWRGNIANMNLKCVSEQIPGLIDLFSGVHPGYHMNKKHWITVDLDGSVPDGEIAQLIDQSYALVVGGLRVKERKALELKWGREVLYGQTSEAWPSPVSNR